MFSENNFGGLSLANRGEILFVPYHVPFPALCPKLCLLLGSVTGWSCKFSPEPLPFHVALGTLFLGCRGPSMGLPLPCTTPAGHHSCCSLYGCTWCYCLASVLTALSACLHPLSGNLLQQEYTLAHLEPPDSLEAAEAGIRKFEDFLMSMENNQDKVLSPVDSGNKLVADKNLYSDKILEKVQLIEDRYSPPPRS